MTPDELRRELYATLVSRGVSEPVAAKLSKYSPNSVGSLKANESIKQMIADKIDADLHTIVDNDLALAKINVAEFEHVRLIKNTVTEIPISAINSAKSRMMDRSSLGPLLKNVSLTENNVVLKMTDAQSADLDRILSQHYKDPKPAPKPAREIQRESFLADQKFREDFDDHAEGGAIEAEWEDSTPWQSVDSTRGD